MSNSPRVLSKPLYAVTATGVGGRAGTVKTDDGKLDLKLAPPPGLGGKGEEGFNPEQLFAAGYAACFGGALEHIARLKKIQTGEVTITTKVTIGLLAGIDGVGLAVELTAKIPDASPDDAAALLKAAHEACPYSQATRGNIVVDVRLA